MQPKSTCTEYRGNHSAYECKSHSQCPYRYDVDQKSRLKHSHPVPSNNPPALAHAWISVEGPDLRSTRVSMPPPSNPKVGKLAAKGSRTWRAPKRRHKPQPVAWEVESVHEG